MNPDFEQTSPERAPDLVAHLRARAADLYAAGDLENAGKAMEACDQAKEDTAQANKFKSTEPIMTIDTSSRDELMRLNVSHNKDSLLYPCSNIIETKSPFNHKKFDKKNIIEGISDLPKGYRELGKLSMQAYFDKHRVELEFKKIDRSMPAGKVNPLNPQYRQQHRDRYGNPPENPSLN